MRTITATTRRRAAWRAIVVVVAAMVMSSCVRVDLLLSVTDADEVNGMLVVAGDRGLLDLGADELPALLDTMYEAVPTHLDGVTSYPYDVGDHVGRTFVFDRVALAEFNDGMGIDPRSWLRIDRRGETFEVTGLVDLTPAALQDRVGELDVAGLSRFTGSADVEVRLSFPGRVQSASGEVNARTVTWTAPVGEATPLIATASASSRPTVQDLLGWPLAVSGGLVVLLVLWWLVRRHDEAADAERHARLARRPTSPTARPSVPAPWSAAHLPTSDHPSYELPDPPHRPPAPPPARPVEGSDHPS